MHRTNGSVENLESKGGFLAATTYGINGIDVVAQLQGGADPRDFFDDMVKLPSCSCKSI